MHGFMDDFSTYSLYKKEGQAFYDSVGEIFSPALREKVRFTAEGFNHIIFTDPRSEREQLAQVARFRLLPLAVRLVGISTTYQEFEEISKQIEVKMLKEKIVKNQMVRYWGIIAILDGYKIKVVIRKIGDGAVHFWSIIPAWTTSKRHDGRFQGSPEND